MTDTFEPNLIVKAVLARGFLAGKTPGEWMALQIVKEAEELVELAQAAGMVHLPCDNAKKWAKEAPLKALVMQFDFMLMSLQPVARELFRRCVNGAGDAGDPAHLAEVDMTNLEAMRAESADMEVVLQCLSWLLANATGCSTPLILDALFKADKDRLRGTE